MGEAETRLLEDRSTYLSIKPREAKYILFCKRRTGEWISFGRDAEAAARILDLECGWFEVKAERHIPKFLQIAEPDIDRAVSRMLQSGAQVALAERI